MKRFLDKLFKRDKWKVYLYYQNRLIKKLYVNEDFQPLDNIYVIRVYFKKYLMGIWNTQVVCEPRALKYTDNEKKAIHIEVSLFGGVE